MEETSASHSVRILVQGALDEKRNRSHSTLRLSYRQGTFLASRERLPGTLGIIAVIGGLIAAVLTTVMILIPASVSVVASLAALITAVTPLILRSWPSQPRTPGRQKEAVLEDYNNDSN
jgi:hypothetical protein